MSYGYGVRTAWIDDLDLDHEPSGYDLCERHADALAVPVGWERHDRRLPRVQLPLFAVA